MTRLARKVADACDGFGLPHSFDALMRHMTEQRDQAIAHDRQPYPTAYAYERTCKRLEQFREALKLIAETNPVDAVLDPDRALRVAQEVLRGA